MQIIKKSKIPQCLISTCVHVNANVLSKAPAIQKFYKTSINKKISKVFSRFTASFIDHATRIFVLKTKITMSLNLELKFYLPKIQASTFIASLRYF